MAKGWNGLADVIANVTDVMATGSCLFQFKFCDVVQNLIPYMRQMVFAYVLIKGWIVDPNVYSFLNQPHEVLILPPHYTEVIKCSVMTCDVAMVIDWGGALEMLFKPFTKGPG